MLKSRRPWQEELEIIDRTMKAISGVTDPQVLVDVYWEGIGELLPITDFVAVSRRNVEPPFYLITRSSRFEEELNPWTQRERLPRLQGGILGEIAYANKPVFIEDLPAHLAPDDPAHFYLQGFERLYAIPQYDNGEGINVTGMLMTKDFELDKTVLPILHWQSGLFGRGTQNLVLKNQLSAALSTLDDELKTVGKIQRSLLPRTLPTIPGFELAAFYQTSARAGGDYYDFFPLDNGHWGLFIADVSGHGTPAAVLMAITHALAHAQPGTHTPPADLLTYLNGHLARSYTRGGTFVTAFYATLDPARRTLTYSTAGHNPPRLFRGKEAIALDQNGALPLGIMPDETYHQATITLERDDLLLLYTDGITESPAPPVPSQPRELFGVERLDALFTGCNVIPPATCLEKVRTALSDFTQNAPPNDDQTLIAIRSV